MKTCIKCGEEKSLQEFPTQKSKCDTLHYRNECKVCRAAYNKAYRERNEVVIKKRRAEYSKQNSKRAVERATKWKKQNPAKVNALTAKRRASKLKATPEWADQDQIKRIYVACAKISEQTGTKHHVDHIIPLQGENVCGLHVENNLAIIPAKMNLQKSNKFRQKNNG